MVQTDVMQAWVIREDRHGPPQQAMQLETVAVPRPGPGQALVAVMAAGVNYNGVWICEGRPVPLSRLRTGYDFHITGSDAAGVVAAVGEGVRAWRPGDEVVLHCNVTCGQCAVCNGLDPLACSDQRIWGYETNWGSFAPFALVDARQLLKRPSHLTWAESASYGLCLFTAYRMLVTRGRLQAGENALIWGAAGGLGVFAVQLCLLLGATPICVVSSQDKAELCRSLGARLIINRTAFDLQSAAGRREFAAEVRRLTDGEGPGLVFEHVGQATFSTSLYVCAKMGRVVVCGATSGYDVGFDARHLWMRQKSIIGSHFANGHDAERANRLVIAGRIRPVLTRVFPYCQTPEALTAQADPSHCGKLAVLVQADAEASGRDGLGTTRSIGDLVDHLR